MSRPLRKPECAPPDPFPRRPSNRPSLDRIDYRIGSYTDFQRSMLRSLDRSAVLSGWTYRGSDDPGIALLEGAAILGDILTFYQEEYANEAFLRTARWRESVADLVRLIGYRLTPGLGGAATFALQVRGDLPIKVPAAFPISATLDGVPGQVDFITCAEVVAYPWLGRFNLYRPREDRPLVGNDKELRIPGIPSPVTLAPGDRVLLGTLAAKDGGTAEAPLEFDRWEVVIVDKVRQFHGETLFTIKGCLRQIGKQEPATVVDQQNARTYVPQVVAFKLGRSFRQFGYNAPRQWVTLDATGNAKPTAIDYQRNYDLRPPTPDEPNPPGVPYDPDPPRVVDPPYGWDQLPLDAQTDVAMGAFVAIHAAGGSEVVKTTTTANAFDRSVPPVSLSLGFDVDPPTGYGTPAGVIVDSGALYDRLTVTRSETKPSDPAPTGYIVEYVEEIERQQTNGDSSWTISSDKRTVTLEAHASAHIDLRNWKGDAALAVATTTAALSLGTNAVANLAVAELWDPVKNRVAGSVKRTVRVHYRSDPVTYTVTVGTTPVSSFDVLVVRRVEKAQPTTARWGALAGASTLLTVDKSIVPASRLGTGPDTPGDARPNRMFVDIRSVAAHLIETGPFTVTAPQVDTQEPRGARLYFFDTVVRAGTLAGRDLHLAPRGGEPMAAHVSAVAAPDPRRQPADLALTEITLDREVDYAGCDNVNPTTDFYGNLLPATQGKRERDAVLGNGDARVAFQTFAVPRAPLTYRAHAGATPPEEPELEVYVGERRWRYVPSLYGHAGDEEVYIVRQDASGQSWVQFGDGLTGVRVPSGVGNVRARYRSGAGAHGRLQLDTSVQAGARLDRLDRLDLIMPASGGTDVEDADGAREAAPGKVQGLGRLVSLSDFETETRAIAGVDRVVARWALVDNLPLITLTVLMRTGREGELASVRETIASWDRERGAQRYPIRVSAGAFQYVYLDLTYAADPLLAPAAVERAVLAALGVTGGPDAVDSSRGLFGERTRGFGEPEYATRVETMVQAVEGMRWVKVNAFTSLGADGSRIIALPAPRDAVVACPPDQVLRLALRATESPLVLRPAVATAGGPHV